MDSYISQHDFEKARGNWHYMEHRLVTILTTIQEKRKEKHTRFTVDEFRDLEELVADLYHRMVLLFKKKEKKEEK